MIELPVLDNNSLNEDPFEQKTWRSLRHLKNDPELLEAIKDEFRPGVSDPPSQASRRQFLQLMGASMALAGLTACRRPEEKILPYTRQPEEIVPGLPLYYATAMSFRGVLRGLLVESHEGRPTKVEGNPQHPTTFGTTSLFEQASVLDLYDPDRSQFVLRAGSKSSWPEFMNAWRQFLARAATGRVVVLAEENSSITLAGLRDTLTQQFPQLRWITYSPEGTDPEMLGFQAAYGRPLRPTYRFSQAGVIVSLDAQFLDPVSRDFVRNTREFAASRRLNAPQDTISRLYVAESTYSITGGKADHRLRVRSSDIPFVASALAARLGLTVPAIPGNPFADHPTVVQMSQDLRTAGARGVVLAGDTQPPEVHALCAAINGMLGSSGTIVELMDTGAPIVVPQAQTLRTAVADMNAGNVDAVILIGANPVYDAPAELNVASALKRVPMTIHLGHHVDETALNVQWHIPRTHYLEAWGDGRAYDGTVSVIQPLIAPLFPETRSEIELVNFLATSTETPGYDLVRSRWTATGVISGAFEEGWRRALNDGFVPGTAYPVTTASAGAAAFQARAVPSDAMEVVFHLDPTVLDGRFANNAWLQETPHQTTKLVWDNAAVMSPATANRLGLSIEYDNGIFNADVIELDLGGRKMTLPVWTLPGHADNSISVYFGYGRKIRSTRGEQLFKFWDTDWKTDVYGHGALGSNVGTNVYTARSAALERVFAGAQVRKTGGRYTLITTQEHGTLEGRPIVRAATLDEYKQHPTFTADAVPPLANAGPWEDYPALWQKNHPLNKPDFKDNLYYANQWGMVIDLNTCTGCSSCMVACQAENNVPVVGKDQVGKGREMHWLRVDRYYMGGEEEQDNPRMAFQPMFCVHCENAPCEPVCPVYATTHSPDGISEMTYNRCIGTRYCSNNCPYKVRHFNYHNWTHTTPETVRMVYNPDVTVRFRGVMEKCTYCVQRVRGAQRRASVEGRPLEDGEVKTACQQVCPADAITFGDINNPRSKVSNLKRNTRRYEVLEHLNTKPRTSYLGLVTNPNPRLTQVTGTPEREQHIAPEPHSAQ